MGRFARIRRIEALVIMAFVPGFSAHAADMAVPGPAYYPTYLQANGPDAGVAGYVHTWLTLNHWITGPAWFLLILFIYDLAAGGQAIGNAQQRHVDSDRFARAQVAIDRPAVERHLADQEAQPEVVARERRDMLAQPL